MQFQQLLKLFTVLAAIIFIVGCGDPKVTGKVSYPDGSPVTMGQVMFQKEGFVGSGDIQPDGSYSAGKMKDGDGLPPGKYQVYISGASTFGAPASGQEQKASEIGKRPNFHVETLTQLVHGKYTSAATSGLSVEVTGRTKYDFTVEKP